MKRLLVSIFAAASLLLMAQIPPAPSSVTVGPTPFLDAVIQMLVSGSNACFAAYSAATNTISLLNPIGPKCPVGIAATSPPPVPPVPPVPPGVPPVIPPPPPVPSTGLAFVNASATQAVFKSPSNQSCSWKVSTSPTLSPLLPDVDPALYADHNPDLTAAVADGTKYVVLGKRKAEAALDGITYSRALPAETKLYYEACGQTGSFSTTTIVLGSTYQDLPPRILPTILSDPSKLVNDPQTGAVVKIAAPHSNNAGDLVAYMYHGGFVPICETGTSGPDHGYMCRFATDGGRPASAYYYVPATDEMRFLGLYIGSTDTTGIFVLADVSPGVAGYSYTTDPKGATVIVKGDYKGDFKPVPPRTNIAMDWSIVRTAKSFVSEIQKFNPKVTMPDSAACHATSTNGDWMLIDCRSGEQDSYPYAEAIFDIGKNAIIAARPMMTNGVTRFCGEHNFQFAPYLGSAALLRFVFHDLTGPTPGSGPFLTTLVSAISATETSFPVSGPPAALPSDIPMSAEPGDMFFFGDTHEYFKIAGRAGNQWTVVRNSTGSTLWIAQPHPAGTRIQAACAGTQTSAESADMYWKFLEDPFGDAAVSSTLWMVGHDALGADLKVGGDYLWTPGPIMQTFDKGPLYRMPYDLRFAGVGPPVAGNSAYAHPSYLQTNDNRWFSDGKIFVGGTPSFGQHTLVSGQLWKYTFEGLPPDYRLHTKILPTLGFSNTTLMADVSGPASSIKDDASASYTYCVALKDGECLAGAKAGEAFGNIPPPVKPYCDIQTPNVTTRLNDWCLVDNPPFGNSVEQFGIVPNSAGLPPTFDNTYINVGAGWSRTLIAGLSKVRTGSTLAKPTPDGKWMLFNVLDDSNGRAELYMARIPTFAQIDAIDRSTFEPIAVSVPPSPAVFLRFWYDEFSTPSSRKCSTRNEACIAVATGKLDQANPFAYESETNGVSCPNGCTITIPAVPGHVLHYSVNGKEFLTLVN